MFSVGKYVLNLCMHCRLLLTRESSECFRLIMDVVRQVIKAAQENMEAERVRHKGNRPVNMWPMLEGGGMEAERVRHKGNKPVNMWPMGGGNGGREGQA